MMQKIKEKITSFARNHGLVVRKYKKEDEYLLYLRKGVTNKFLYINNLYERIKDLNGDVVECGIGRGVSLQMLVLLAEREGKSRHVWGFDSFEGFPEPTKEDIRDPKYNLKQTQVGDLNWMRYEDIYPVLEMTSVGKDFIKNNVTIVKGFFENTLPKAPINKITLLNLDVDLYQSYKECLTYLFPKVVKGGVILFDEYKREVEVRNFPGASIAIDEYFKNTPYAGKIKQDPIYKRYFLIKE